MFKRSNFSFIKAIIDHVNSEIKLEWLRSKNLRNFNIIHALIDNR